MSEEDEQKRKTKIFYEKFEKRLFEKKSDQRKILKKTWVTTTGKKEQTKLLQKFETQQLGQQKTILKKARLGKKEEQSEVIEK